MLLLLVACGAAEDSGAKVDNTCAFGPQVTIDSPEDGATVAVGDTLTFSATASSNNTDTQYLQILWVAEGLTGDATGSDDTAGVGASVDWTVPAAGDWRIYVQVDDDCSSDPMYDIDPAQKYVDILAQ